MIENGFRSPCEKPSAMEEENFANLRRSMIQVIALHAHLASSETGKEQLDSRVLEAMDKVPRHEFVPSEMLPYAYLDSPLPIGYGKTISQPFIVALMTDLLDLRPGETVLEIGTGLGYQAAILSKLADKVFSVEIVEELGAQAMKNLRRLGCKNVEVRIGDGAKGWAEHMPFDKILVAAGVELIPPPLIHQLKSGGKMVIPTGMPDTQQLTVVEKDPKGRVSTRQVLPVRFGLLETEEGEETPLR